MIQSAIRQVSYETECNRPLNHNTDQITSTPSLSPVSDEKITSICNSVMDIMSALFNVSGPELRQSGRSNSNISRVRQIGMYVSHVMLGLSMTDVSKGFKRDRTTVMHACHLIEDMRDDDEFDQLIRMSEQITAVAFRHLGVIE